MSNIYVVLVRPVNRMIPPHEIDATLTPLGDWFRFNGLSWFVESEASAAQIQSGVRQALTNSDSLVVVKVDLSDYSGWAPRETWDWLQSKLRLANVLTRGLAGLGSDPSFGEMVRGEGLGSPFRSPFASGDDEKK